MRYLTAITLLVACCKAATLTVGSGQTYSTLQAAMDAAAAGDTVHVIASYAGAGGRMMPGHASGTANSRIIIEGEAGATINAANASNQGISTDEVNYVTIQGFTITAGQSGIKVTNCTGCRILNNDVSGSTASGILTGYAPGILVQGNTTHSNGSINSQHGIYVSNSNTAVDAPVIRGNTAYSNNGNGIQVNAGCPASSTDDGFISGALLENNIIHDNGGSAFSIINMADSIIRNNVAYNTNSTASVKFSDDGDCGYGSKRNVVVNNTFASTGGTTCVRIVNLATPTSTGNIIFNNFCINTSSQDCTIDLDASACGNGTDAGVNYFQAGLKRTISQVSAGGYVTDWTNHDLTLVSGSAAIGAGATSFHSINAPPVDFLGNGRPVSTYDAGAYEFGGSAAGADTTAPTAPGTPSATPTPYQVALSWSASTDAREVLWYYIYRDGTAVGLATTASFTDTTVTSGTMYSYTVKAIDGSGNLSDASSATEVTPPGIDGCLNADTTWRYRQTPTLTGTFTLEWDGTPWVSSTNDASMGFSQSVPAAYTALGISVRFANGVIDARNGAAFAADASVPFSIGTSYHFRMPVNLTNHTYSVYVTPSGGPETLLAANYSFRTEQGLSTSIGYGSIYDDVGSASMCNILVSGLGLNGMKFLTITDAQTGASFVINVFSHPN